VRLEFSREPFLVGTYPFDKSCRVSVPLGIRFKLGTADYILPLPLLEWSKMSLLAQAICTGTRLHHVSLISGSSVADPASILRPANLDWPSISVIGC